MITSIKLNKNSGFTLIEVLIAMFILSVGILAVVSMFTTSMKASQLGRNVTVANRLAQNLMEQVKTQTFDQVIIDLCIDSDSDGNSDTGISNCQPFTPTSPVSVACGVGVISLSRGRTGDFIQSSGGINTVKYNVRLEEVQDFPICGLSNITVTVTWSDAYGAHTTKLITYIEKP